MATAGRSLLGGTNTGSDFRLDRYETRHIFQADLGPSIGRQGRNDAAAGYTSCSRLGHHSGSAALPSTQPKGSLQRHNGGVGIAYVAGRWDVTGGLSHSASGGMTLRKYRSTETHGYATSRPGPAADRGNRHTHCAGVEQRDGGGERAAASYRAADLRQAGAAVTTTIYNEHSECI